MCSATYKTKVCSSKSVVLVYLTFASYQTISINKLLAKKKSEKMGSSGKRDIYVIYNLHFTVDEI